MNSDPIKLEGITVEPFPICPIEMDYAKAWEDHQQLIDHILSTFGVPREPFAFTSTEQLKKRSDNQLFLECCLSTVVTPSNTDLVDTPIIVEDNK